jgi:hypothetical protein
MRSEPMKETTMTAAAAARTLAVCAALMTLTTAAQAQDYRYSLTPYLWLPNINGTLKYPLPPGTGGGTDVENGPNSYLDNLRVALMISGDVRRGSWSAFTDLIYLHFDSESSKIRSVDFPNLPGNDVSVSLDAGTDTTLKGLAWTLGAGYALVDSAQGRFEVLGGVRYLKVDATTDWRLTRSISAPGGGASFPSSGRIAADTTLWDAIVGVRGRARLGASNWSVRYYADIGTGSSQLTWHGLVGVDYAFAWGDLAVAYRHLAYDEGSDKLMQNFRFSGPALGATFRF